MELLIIALKPIISSILMLPVLALRVLAVRLAGRLPVRLRGFLLRPTPVLALAFVPWAVIAIVGSIVSR